MDRERITPKFTQEERQEIAALAGRIAEIGEPALDGLVSSKIRLCMISVAAINSAESVEQKLAVAEGMIHELHVVNEVLHRAGAIRQIWGVDELSELDRHFQEAGMGSLFDEDSEASRRLKKNLI